MFLKAFTLDEGVSKEISWDLQGLNLSQEQGQKLVDFYTAKTAESANRAIPRFGKRLRSIGSRKSRMIVSLGHDSTKSKTTISRAIDGLNDPKLARDFREAMDYTGAGNNPAFIRAFWKLAQMSNRRWSCSRWWSIGAGPAKTRRTSRVQLELCTLTYHKPSHRPWMNRDGPIGHKGVDSGFRRPSWP